MPRQPGTVCRMLADVRLGVLRHSFHVCLVLDFTVPEWHLCVALGFRRCYPGALPRITVTASNVYHESARDHECAVPLPAGLCCVPIMAVGWSYLPLDGIVNSAMIWLNTSTFRTLGRSNGHNRIIVNLSASNALAAFFQLYWFFPNFKFDLCFIEAIGNQVPAGSGR